MPGHDLSLSTLAVGAGRPARTPGGPLNAPITLASALVPGGDSEYGRHGNPAWDAFETALGALEGGQALAFASGQAAAAAVIDLVPLHGVVVAPEHAYSGTLVQLNDRARRGMLELRLVDVTDLEAIRKASDGAALVWMESPTNPMLDVADLEAIAGITTSTGTALAVD
ncbi:MAG: cystathionine gamma-synthase, partial [Actinomycetales bacterium]